MAKIKEIWVDSGLTLNLGNYESARMNAGVKLTVGEDEAPVEVFKAGWKIVEAEIEKQAKDITTEMTKRKGMSS